MAILLPSLLTIIVTLFPATLAQNISTPLVNFQVTQPLTLPKSVHKCEVPLIHRVFANSYYVPEIVQYTPPTDCGPVGSWAGISLNWTATSNGTQYDRLAGVTLGNVEIWRTSTSEPTVKGIIWTALKDVTKYIPLFSKPNTLIVDLNNVLDPSSGLTGEFDVHLTATFYQSDWIHPKAPSPDIIIPLSTLSEEQSNVFSAPPAGNTTVTLPRNAVRAIAEIQASGNSQEEFWYFNLPNEFLPNLPSETTYGRGSFREVRLLVDGQVAGLIFPYPVIFTGAFVPTIWRPIVAYGAYDAPTYNIDLTPFIPLLADGNPHIISLDVASDELDHLTNSNWYLGGNLKVALDTSSKPTTGNIIKYSVSPYATSRHTATPFSDDSYNFTVNAEHSLLIESTIITGSGAINHVVWRQDLQFRNLQTYINNGTAMSLSQISKGSSLSTHNSIAILKDNVEFPLSIDYANVVDQTGSGWTAAFDHQYNREYLPTPWEVFASIRSSQHGNGTYIRYPNEGYNRTANGTNLNDFSYTDAKLNTYYRSVDVTNNTIKKDRQGGSLTWDFWPLASGLPRPVPTSNTNQSAIIPMRLPGNGDDASTS
ncbi:hypothetical protein CPB86DRAFT_748030 [Serendipita vermifera]|nr:hypothetical protein CPB86DRAFT_748030 [Serendipita vermifera]